MLAAGIDFKFLEHRVAQHGFGHHAADGVFDDLGGMLFQHLLIRDFLETAGVAAEGLIYLLQAFQAGYAHFFGVDDHDEVAGVDVAHVIGLVLSAEDGCDLCGKASQGQTRGINDIPGALDVTGARCKGFHRFSFTDFSSDRQNFSTGCSVKYLVSGLPAHDAFKDEDFGKEYQYSLYVTNNQTASPYDIWCYYRPRANVENIIENLKNGYGLSAYNMKSFWATEAVLMAICLILHNLVTVLIKQVLHTVDKDRKLRTLRMEYLVIPAFMGKSGRDDVLRLGISSHKRRTKFTKHLPG